MKRPRKSAIDWFIDIGLAVALAFAAGICVWSVGDALRWGW